MATKELWQMTRREVSVLLDIPNPEITKSILDNHEKAVTSRNGRKPSSSQVKEIFRD